RAPSSEVRIFMVEGAILLWGLPTLILGDNLDADGALGIDGTVEKPEDFSSITASLPRKGKPNVTDLTVYRCYRPLLTRHEERELIRRAQAGDKQAETRLVQQFHGLILTAAKVYMPDPRLSFNKGVGAMGIEVDHPEFEDLVAAGVAGLLEAIRRFNLRRRTRLSTYAAFYIKGACCKEANRWKLGGTKHLTRLERWCLSHPLDKPEWIQQDLSRRCREYALEAIEGAQYSLSRRRSLDYYEGTLEGGNNEDCDPDNWSTENAPVSADASHDLCRGYSCFSPYQLAPHLRKHECVSRTIDAWARSPDL